MASVDEHDEHDPSLVVGYVDDELDADERATAEAQIETCKTCAALAADLRAMAAADRSMATPARPRDFRLTPADAARLSAMAEPEAAGTRQVDAMPSLPADHATHDPLLIAAAADDTLETSDEARVTAWLATCAACVELQDDLRAIAAANRTLPTPARPRDFRLTPADAARLRGHGLRGFLARIGSPRDGFSRPLAMGLTTLGLAGLLLSGGTSLLSFGSSGASGTILSTVGAPISEQQSKGTDVLPGATAAPDFGVFTGEGDAASAAPSAAAAAAPLASAAPLAPEAGPDIAGGASTSDGYAPVPTDAAALELGGASQRQAAVEPAPPAATPAPPTLAIVSVVLLGIGVALFAIRWMNRRRPA